MHRLALVPANLAQGQSYLTGFKCQGLQCKHAGCDLGLKQVFARSEVVLRDPLWSFGRKLSEARLSLIL